MYHQLRKATPQVLTTTSYVYLLGLYFMAIRKPTSIAFPNPTCSFNFHKTTIRLWDLERTNTHIQETFKFVCKEICMIVTVHFEDRSTRVKYVKEQKRIRNKKDKRKKLPGRWMVS